MCSVFAPVDMEERGDRLGVARKSTTSAVCWGFGRNGVFRSSLEGDAVETTTQRKIKQLF